MRIGATVLAIAGALALSAPAQAAPQHPDFHDARYCEVLELRGEVPNAVVTVWNTIGLNDCPPAKWEALDAGAIAAERGDAAVILNGPRHFLMDSAEGRIGATETFGDIRMRKVATIPIKTAAELVQTPFTERRIKRHNTWTWEAGRRVYQLLAPDGTNYLMQSYSQIRDPELSIGQLRSLGDRLTLPQGWTYRSHRLKHDLTLHANGTATVIQDDLQNTYQRLPRDRRSKPKGHDVAASAATKTVASPTPGTLEDRGTITGKPFGDGTLDLVAIFGDDSTVTGTFEVDAAKGSAFGTLAMTYVISGNQITFDGAATFTGGTGPYRGITGTVAAHDENTLDGQNGSVSLTGRVRY